MLATERIRSRDMQGRLTYSAIKLIKQLTGIDIHRTDVDIKDTMGDYKAIHPQYDSAPGAGHLLTIGLVILHDDVIGGMALVGIGLEGLDLLPRQNAVVASKRLIGTKTIIRKHQRRLMPDDALPEQPEVNPVEQQKHQSAEINNSQNEIQQAINMVWLLLQQEGDH